MTKILLALAAFLFIYVTFFYDDSYKKKELEDLSSYKRAYFAGGCFWGVEYYFEKQKGVKEVYSGFMGGETKNPSYYSVVFGKTGHIETVEVIYDEKEVSYKELAKLFFQIHDSTQKDGQGPDIGEQYLSYVFYNNEEEKQTTQELIDILKNKNYDVATKLQEKSDFYKAENNHQDYYLRNGKTPYCHVFKKIFD